MGDAAFLERQRLAGPPGAGLRLIREGEIRTAQQPGPQSTRLKNMSDPSG